MWTHKALFLNQRPQQLWKLRHQLRVLMWTHKALILNQRPQQLWILFKPNYQLCQYLNNQQQTISWFSLNNHPHKILFWNNNKISLFNNSSKTSIKNHIQVQSLFRIEQEALLQCQLLQISSHLKGCSSHTSRISHISIQIWSMLNLFHLSKCTLSSRWMVHKQILICLNSSNSSSFSQAINLQDSLGTLFLSRSIDAMFCIWLSTLNLLK